MTAREIDSWERHRASLIFDPPALIPDGTVRFAEGWAMGVPARGGVYLIRDLRGTLYVGRSDELRARFLCHLQESHNRFLNAALANRLGETQFIWVLADGDAQRRLERVLVTSLQPLCNCSLTQTSVNNFIESDHRR